MYDLIGDVHGYAEELRALLRRLGYRERRGVWRHAERTALFVGDLVDRGPDILGAVRLVRGMHEAGAARVILGNHELNLLGYCTDDPARTGETLRRRSEKNTQQHRATLEQLGDELDGHLDWIRTLPFHLDLGDLRTVHACWDPQALALLGAERRRYGGLTEAFLVDAYRRGSALGDAVEVALKGPEIALPDSFLHRDTYGRGRRRARARWYVPVDGHTLGSYCLPEIPELRATPLPDDARDLARPYPPNAPPLFFGHYALVPRTPAAAVESVTLTPNIACLDLGVAKPGGALCAYRFDGEPNLDPDHLEVVPRGLAP